MASSRRPPSGPRPAAPRPARSSSQGGRYPQVTKATVGRSDGRSEARSWTTPGAGQLRTKIETASRAPLLRMHAAPRWSLFLAFLGLAVGAGLAPALWGALCAAVLAVFLAWLLFLAWPRLTSGPRAVRVLVIAILVGAVIAKIAIG